MSRSGVGKTELLDAVATPVAIDSERLGGMRLMAARALEGSNIELPSVLRPRRHPRYHQLCLLSLGS